MLQLVISNPADSDYVLMQYTGVKDVNGRDIYEGDIVERASERLSKGGTAWYQRTSQYDGPIRIRGVVFYVSARFAVDWDHAFNQSQMTPRGKEVDPRGFYEYQFDGYKPGEDFEVIGNVHENPDLLSGATS